tara:strand:- start:495 stop:1139 length:645 start_codon:yes stop_codon:yes gene_type:complete
MKYEVRGFGPDDGYNGEDYGSYQIFDIHAGRSVVVAVAMVGQNLAFKHLEEALNMCACLNMGYLARLEGANQGNDMAPYQDGNQANFEDAEERREAEDRRYDDDDEDFLEQLRQMPDDEEDRELKRYELECKTCGRIVDYDGEDDDDFVENPGWSHITQNHGVGTAYKGFCPDCKPKRPVKKKAAPKKKKKYVAPADRIPKAHQEDDPFDDFPF